MSKKTEKTPNKMIAEKFQALLKKRGIDPKEYAQREKLTLEKKHQLKHRIQAVDLLEGD